MASAAATSKLQVDLLARICSQFGSDNANVRRMAARMAQERVDAAGCRWQDIINDRAIRLVAYLEGIAQEDADAAELTLAANTLVGRTVTNWETALRASDRPQGKPFGMNQRDFEAAMRRANGGKAWPWAEGEDDEPPAKPRTPPRQRTVRRNIPVVVTGKIELVSQYVDARGRTTFEFLVRDMAEEIEYGPLVTRDERMRRKLIDGIGKVMRVTTRQASRPHEKQEAIRAVPGNPDQPPTE